MYKKVVNLNTSIATTEFYLQDVTGKTVALRRKVGAAAAVWDYYVNGAEREARLSNVTHNGQIDVEEIEFYLYDHLGNTRIVYQPAVYMDELMLDIKYAADYFPYGKVLREYMNSGSGAEKFLTTQHERDKETGLDYRGARYYDADIARFLSLDPMQIQRLSLTPYNYVSGNPIIRVDPDGKLDDEYKVTYDKNGKKTEEKVSNLGGDKVDFKHIHGGSKDGRTLIENREDGATTYISTSQFIEGYKHRSSSVNAMQIAGEFMLGYGHEKSLISSGQMINDIQKSNIFKYAYGVYLRTGEKFVNGKFGLKGAIEAGNNFTEQMIGTANFNFYPVGNKTVVMITDSKSMSSLTPTQSDGDEVNVARSKSYISPNNTQKGLREPKTTTYQTYLLLMNNK